MMLPENAKRPLERGICVVILITLAAIAIGVLLQQSSFNPAVLAGTSVPASASTGRASAPLAWLPAELKEFGAAEHFTPENLYDKIDGKAELYVSAGVVAMNCQRFALKNSSDEWLEWFVYDMGSVPAAFSVFSTQRRSEGKPLDLTQHAYSTPNALFFVSGSNYVEAVASSASGPLMKAMLEMARAFVGAHSGAGGDLKEIELLPTENLIAGTATMQASDAFGFDQFRNVYTAQYKINGAGAIAFVTTCSDAAAAEALSRSYRAFLTDNGGKETTPVADVPGIGAPIEIIGTFEMVFCRGNLVAGVHSAPTRAAAEELARALHQRLAQKLP